MRAQALVPATDLALSVREAARARVPLLVFFSQPGCPYCELARRDFLEPMHADPENRARLRLLEVDITSDAPMTDFGGLRTTHAAFARTHRVRFVPTVAFFGTGGRVLAEPLVGLTVVDFYQTYLDRRIEQSLEALKVSRR